jgi:hypothetical protein
MKVRLKKKDLIFAKKKISQKKKIRILKNKKF